MAGERENGRSRAAERGGVSRQVPEERWVVKANDLINARYSWDQMTNRLVNLAVEQIALGDEEFQPVRVQISDYADLLETGSKYLYERAKQLSEEFLALVIELPLPDGFIEVNVLSMARYREGEGYVTVKFNDDMKPLLLQLKERFTKYRLRNVFTFRSFVSHRIYELCKQYQGIGLRTLSVEDLRALLRMEDKYPRYRDFKRRVLEQARKEINERSDLRIGYDEIRIGRSVEAVRFKIRSVPQRRLRATESEQGALFPAEEMERDAFELWFDEQPADVQRTLRERAASTLAEPFRTRYAEEKAGKGVSPVVQAQLYAALRRIWDTEIKA